MKTQPICVLCLLATCPLADVFSQQPATPQSQANSSHEFTLKGISRFGDNYHVAIVAGDGNRVEVAWNSGEESVLEGYPGVNVIEVDAANVTLAFAAQEACFTQIAPDVDCSANRTTQVLSLALGDPLPPPDAIEATNDPNQAAANNNAQIIPTIDGEGIAIDPELIIRGEEIEALYGIGSGQAINRDNGEAEAVPGN